MAILRKKGYSLREIKDVMQRSISTLSDELSRNKVNGSYDPKKAQHKAYVRRKGSKYQGMKIVLEKELRSFVEKSLLNDQSPEGISGRLTEQETNLLTVSKNSIYRFIKSPYGRQIEFVRERKKRKGRRNKRQGQDRFLANRKFIDERPEHINLRENIGDAESDFIISGKNGKGILLVVVDRKSRVSFLEKIINVSINNIHQAFQRIKERFPEMNTITTDNDLLLQKYQELEIILLVKIFFCHQYHSWEKGTVENTNKYIRKDIPKGSDISKYSKKFIASLEEKLNQRFMKCLNYATPNEVLSKFRQTKKTP